MQRYAEWTDYVKAIEAAARRLVDEGLMLQEDIERVIAAANDWGRPRHDIKSF